MKKILLFASAVAVLFSSCSTDNTQDVIGNEAMGTISAAAAYQQEATRTYLEGKKVFWSKGDALGVFGASGPQVQFGLTSGEGTASAKFAGNKNYLKVGEPVYAYYPYTKGTSLEDTSKVKLEILAEQTFEKVGSFDAAMAPAYAYIPKLESKDDVIAFTMQGAAAYLSVPVKGMGTLESLSLYIDGQQLNGVAAVDIAGADDPETKDVDETPAIKFDMSSPATIEQKTNTVNCGGAVVLEPFKAVEVMFVVPAGVDVKKEITVTAVIDGKTIYHKRPAEINSEYVTKANEKVTIVYDSKATTLVDAAWSFGLEKKYVISGDNDQAALDFLAYAYLAQADNYLRPNTDYVYGTNGSTAEDWAALEEYFGENPYQYAAISFVEKIDLDAFDADAKFAEFGAIVNPTSKDKFYRNVLTWYINNEYAIESLHDYWDTTGIIGGLTTPTEITGLKVLGNGISTGAFLSNIKFTNTTVIATQNDFAGFVAPKGDTANVEDVVIGENNQLIATAAGSKYVGGIAGYYYVSAATIDVDVEAVPTVVTTLSLDETAIGQLYGIVIADKNMVISLADNNVTSLDAPVIYEATAKGVIDVTSEIAAPEGAKFAGIVAKNTGASIVVNNVSYWNGLAYDTNGGDDYFTAEELAYALQTAGAALDTELTHNIDMQCYVKMNEAGDAIESQQVIALSHNASQNINLSGDNGENADFEIKNIIATNNGWAKSLFGYNATLSDIKFSNVQLDMTGEYVFMAGLAKAGTAKNVVVDGLVINIADDVVAKSDNAYYTNSIGGVFSEVDTDDIDNVDVKALVINYAGENNLGARAGIIAGTLNVITNSKGVTLKPFAISGAKTAYAFTNVAKVQPALTNEKSGIDGYKKSNNYGTTYAFGTVSVNNADFAATHQEAILNVANVDFCPWAKAFAAGIVFADELTSKAAGKVNYDAAKVADYDYAFLTNAPIRASGNTGYKVWGFNKK